MPSSVGHSVVTVHHSLPPDATACPVLSESGNGEFGSPRLRASCHDRRSQRRRGRALQALTPAADVIANRHVLMAPKAPCLSVQQQPMVPSWSSMYRSSSSLELAERGSTAQQLVGVAAPCRPTAGVVDLSAENVVGRGSFRREFGSHGAIDVVGRCRYNVNPPSNNHHNHSHHTRHLLQAPHQLFIRADSSSSSPRAVLKEYRSLDPDCLPSDAEIISCSSLSLSSTTGDPSATTVDSDSPPTRTRTVNRLQRLWENKDRRSSRKAPSSTGNFPLTSSASATFSSCPSSDSGGAPSSSIFRRLRGGTGSNGRTDFPVTCSASSALSVSGGSADSSTSVGGKRASDSCLPASAAYLDAEARREERRRRRVLVHYDWRSLLVTMRSAACGWQRDQLKAVGDAADTSVSAGGTCLSSSSSVVGGDARRRNTATGASAVRSASDHSIGCDQQLQRANELLESCAMFCNELGGEPERSVSLAGRSSEATGEVSLELLHRPAATCCLSVLEQPPSLTHWPVHHCPFQRPPQPPLENSTLADFYYKDFFYGKPHENWVGVDEAIGPIAISVRRDQLTVPVAPSSPRQSSTVPPDDDNTPLVTHTCYRVIVRCSELHAVRGLVLEESLSLLGKSGDKQKRLPVREILDSVIPEVHTSCLNLAVPGKKTEDYLMKLDEQNVFSRYKVGVMYCRAGQRTEDEMYSNEQAGPAFDEFLDMIGQRVRLRGFDKYKAGLDTKSDTTGLYSVYTQYQGNEIMFHVSTMLQYSPNNRQQLLRKRYIGNDIVTIVFQEPGACCFSPKHIRSQFQHVFIVVRAINPCSGTATKYRLAVSRFQGVPVFGPPLSESAVYVKGKNLADLICAKVINAENAAYRSQKFVAMARRTRQEYLKDLAANYITDTLLDQQQKFSLMSFGARKRERPRVRFNPDIVQRGAISWSVLVDDHVTNKQLECVLGVSADAVVLAARDSGDLVFAAPSCSVLAWNLQGSSLRLYYHQGECIVLHAHTAADTEELAEIAARLAVVSSGSETQELLLKRGAMGQLGLHVQQDGVVTEVEPHCSGWGQGLRPGARLVEICKVAVCTMTYEQMVDLLKTSPIVSVTLVPPSSSSSARFGCTMAACGRLSPPLLLVDTARPCSSPASCQCDRQVAPNSSPSLSSSGYNTAASSSSGSCGPTAANVQQVGTRGAGGQLTPPPLPTRFRVPSSAGCSDSTVSAGARTRDDTEERRVEGGGGAGEHAITTGIPAAPPLHYRSHQDISGHYNNYSHPASGTIVPEQCNHHSISTYLVDAPTCLGNKLVGPRYLSPSGSRGLGSRAASDGPTLQSSSHFCSVDSLNTFAGGSFATPLTNGSAGPAADCPPSGPCSARSSPLHSTSVGATRDGGACSRAPRRVPVPSPSVSYRQPIRRGPNSGLNSPAESKRGSGTSSTTHCSLSSSSTLQQELRRLIAPDSPPIITSAVTSQVDDIVMTTAHPATVLSLDGSAEKQWWPGDHSSPSPSHSHTSPELRPAVPGSGQSGCTAVCQPTAATSDTADARLLHDRLNSLEQQLASEQDRRHSLENQVHQLSQDNRRLQDESKQAAQQLRKFTEWFFNNFEKS